MALTSTQSKDAYQFFIVAFGAAPGVEYLNQLDDAYGAGMTTKEIVNVYATKPQFLAQYPSFLSNEQFADKLIENVVGASATAAAKTEAKADVVGALNEGWTKGDVVFQIFTNLANKPTTDALWGATAQMFNNKVEVAQYATETLLINTTDLAQLRALVANVTAAPASVDAAKAVAAGATGQTFTLTEGVAAGADVMRLTGDMNVRIDLTTNDNQVKGLDLDGDGAIAADGVENNNPTALDDGKDFEIVDAYSRDKLNEGNTQANFLGDINFDGTGFAGDGVNTDGNIFLGGLGADTALGGIGNDFMVGGGVAQARIQQALAAWVAAGNSPSTFVAPGDALHGGRNADFFFAELSLLDNVDGNNLTINGGSTSDDAAVGNNTPQDSDWLLFEASDDEDGTQIDLSANRDQNADDETLSVTSGAGQTMQGTNIEHVDASGNLYGFLNDFAGTDLVLGNAGGVNSNGEYQGIGASAQLHIIGSTANNILIGGYDNDRIEGLGGNDLLMGGNLNYAMFNANAAGIVNNGMDELIGGAGSDNIVFEADGGIIEGGSEIDADDNEVDTLWLTRESLGSRSADQLLADGTLRFDLAAGKNGGIDNAAGYGGADAGGTAAGWTADQTNYVSESSRVQVQDMENVIATGLGAIDYRAAGSNDPELNFNNQQNHFAYNGDLDLRGTAGDNTLYAAAGNDVLEGRAGNDLLSGGEGNDDFLFNVQGGDGLDVIHRQTDIGNNMTDGTFGRDFGLGGASTTGPSTLSVDFAAANLADANVFMESFSVSIGGATFAVTDAVALAAVTTVAELAALANAAFQAIDPAVTVSASGNTLTITDATVGGGRDISDLPAEGYDVSIKVIAPGTGTLGLPVYTAPGTAVAEDRLLFVSYQDRLDNERVDDDAVFGGDSLGGDAYAQDLVVSFNRDGSTVLAEDQAFRVTLTNLAVQDEVTVTVNGVQYTLTVGRALDGTLIANESTDAFAQRLADYITNFLDDDTAAGKVVAAFDADPAGPNAASFVLRQAAYSGEETVFMQVSVDVDDNSSLGERATATVTNESQTDITLFQFDGRNGELNARNVLFLGDTGISRAVLATAADAGGNLFGSDAIVVNVTADADVVSSAAEGIDGATIFFNDAENPTTGETANYAIHGDDQLFGGAGNDNIRAGTGDDRVYGSLGLDTVDGGKDIYLVDGEIRVLNRFEAAQLDALPTTIDLRLLGDLDGDGSNQDHGLDAGQNAAFDDTLMLQQADIGAGATFEVTLDLTANQANGGAGKVVVNGNEAANRTLFTNFENIRTVSGNGTLAGQGNDTLDLSVSVNPLTGVETLNSFNMLYRLDSSANAGEVYLDRNDNDVWAADELVIAVDGVEHVKFGSGDDELYIDETEAGKNNNIDGGLGDDLVAYSFDGADTLKPAVTMTVNGGGADVDHVDMAGGSLKAGDVPRDALTSIETVDFGDALENPSLADTLNVTNVAGAVVSFVDTEVLSGATKQVELGSMDDFEVVVAGTTDDTVIVGDTSLMANSNNSDANGEVQFESFLNYDRLDGTDRQTIGDLRAANQALPEWENIGRYTFDLGTGSDTVDYSDEAGLIAAIVALNGTTSSVSNVLVAADGDLDPDDNGENNNRIDSLVSVENIVASEGESIIDLTNAGMDLKIRFNADDGPVSTNVALDRDVFRIQLSELNSTVPVTGVNFIEYFDAGDSALVNQATAAWNTIEGSDFDEMVELTDHETAENHTFNLRGGDNEVNYNELTRSIQVSVDVVEYDAGNASTTGLITAGVTFTDGNNVVIGGQDEITSYSAQNGIAAGSLRIEASQDAEDSVTFASGLDKLFILGQVVNGSDQITVTVGEAGAQNSLVLTGFEVLLDAASDDVYNMDDLDRVVNNLTLTDNVAADHDTIAVDIDAVSYGAVPADTIDLGDLNTQFTFDFDVLDITAVTASNLILIGDTTGAGDMGATDEVVIDNLAQVADIQEFESVVLNQAALGSGTSFTFDVDAGELIQGATTVTFDGALTTLSFGGLALEDADSFVAPVTSGVTVTVVDDGAVGVTVIGGAGNDTITGGAGADTIVGGAGADVMDGNIVPEVTEVVVVTLNGGAASLEAGDVIVIAGVTIDDTGVGAGDISVVAGSDADQVGSAFAAWAAVPANLATIEANLLLTAGDLASVTYDSVSNNIMFSFTSQAGDVASGVVTVNNAGMVTGTLAAAVFEDGADAATQSVAYAPQGDAVDTFVYQAASDSTAAAMDEISNFSVGAVDDIIDLSAVAAAAPLFHAGVQNGGSAFANFAAVSAAANAYLQTHVNSVFVGSDGTDSWVFADANHSINLDAGDVVIKLVGIDATGIDANNFAFV